MIFCKYETIELCSVVARISNPATLETEFWNGVGSVLVGGNSLSMGG